MSKLLLIAIHVPYVSSDIANNYNLYFLHADKTLINQDA